MKHKIFICLIIVLLAFSVCGAKDKKALTSWDWLKEMIPIPGVSGHENKIADFIQDSIPKGLKSQRDEMENVWFTVGQGKPHILFLAHTDELGFTIERITPEGTLKVKRQGGFFPQMYEGHGVVIYTSKGPVNGIVVPRPNYLNREVNTTFTFETLDIYVGVSAKEEALALGLTIGDQITIRKRINELSPHLIAARAVDDRAGCAALLAALYKLDLNKIKGKTITFAWDVQEEIGLFGASRLAKTLKVDVVFPVDTFVSSDGPLDSKRFAFLPLGQGAVIRAIDSSNIAPRFQVERVINIAKKNGIPFQIGNTRGGNDGSVFVPGTAVDIPLSWPGTYSHSFIEKIHRKDLESLTNLIVAIARDW